MRNCKVKKGLGWVDGFKFHSWGFGAEEGSGGNAGIMWSIGIVESPDGEIMEFSPSSIWFTS